MTMAERGGRRTWMIVLGIAVALVGIATAVALWIGGETGDLPPECGAFEPVSIPMAGRVESLNLAVAASVLLFAASAGRGRAT